MKDYEHIALERALEVVRLEALRKKEHAAMVRSWGATENLTQEGHEEHWTEMEQNAELVANWCLIRRMQIQGKHS